MTAAKPADKKSQKAQKALKAVKKSTWKQTRKPRFSTTFHRPKTFEAPRTPKFPRLRYNSSPQLARFAMLWTTQHRLMAACLPQKAPKQEHPQSAEQLHHYQENCSCSTAVISEVS